MLILSLDCAGAGCGVCVWQDGHILAQACEAMQRGQDARLMPMVIDTLAKAGVGFADLNRIAVTRGPGSFTGLRVGLAAARGLGLAAQKPVIGIDRFALFHRAAGTTEQNHLVVIDSKRAEFFCQFFPASAASHEPVLMTQSHIDEFLLEHAGCLVSGDSINTTVNITALCAELAAEADPEDPRHRPSPLYLRAPDVTLPRVRT